MVIRKPSLVFLILGILFAMIYLLVIISGNISDSRLYFEFYTIIQEKGYFYFLNFIIILILFFVISKFYKKKLYKKFILNSICFISLLFLWYPIYSNILWVLRNFIEVELLIISLFNTVFLSRLLILTFGLTFHFSSILDLSVIFVFLKITNFLNRFEKYTLTALLVLAGAISGLIVLKFFNLFSFLASGNTDLLDTYNGANIVGGLIGIYLFVLILHFSTIKNIVDETYKKRYIFLYSIISFVYSSSLVFLNNHFIIHRILIFSSLLYVIFYV